MQTSSSLVSLPQPFPFEPSSTLEVVTQIYGGFHRRGDPAPAFAPNHRRCCLQHSGRRKLQTFFFFSSTCSVMAQFIKHFNCGLNAEQRSMRAHEDVARAGLSGSRAASIAPHRDMTSSRVLPPLPYSALAPHQPRSRSIVPAHRDDCWLSSCDFVMLWSFHGGLCHWATPSPASTVSRL